MPLADLIIGACALELGYAVATHNVRHFQLIPGLDVRQFRWGRWRRAIRVNSGNPAFCKAAYPPDVLFRLRDVPHNGIYG